jgi:cytochrome P450
VTKTVPVTADFDPLQPETFSSFHEQFDALRRSCPVAHSDAWNGFWALTRYDDVAAAAADPSLFTTTVQNVVPKVAFTGRRPPLHLDPPEHTPYRRALNPFFSAAKMAALEPPMRRVVVGLLEPLVARGRGDICAEFSHLLPGHALALFFNLTPDEGMEIREATREFVAAVQRFELDAAKRTSLALYDIARALIADRKAHPRDPGEDPVAGLLAARADGEPLPEDMLLGTIRQFIVVGMVAPCVFIGSMAVHLAQHPELQQQLRGNLSLVPAAVEEYLRLLTPYRGFARTPTRDVEVGGRVIRKDAPVALVFASANRDETVFPDPDAFVLDRPNIRRHLAFGVGPHRCAGSPLAVLMLRLTLEELLTLTASIEQDGEPTMTGWPEWGTLSAPMRLTPA